MNTNLPLYCMYAPRKLAFFPFGPRPFPSDPVRCYPLLPIPILFSLFTQHHHVGDIDVNQPTLAASANVPQLSSPPTALPSSSTLIRNHWQAPCPVHARPIIDQPSPPPVAVVCFSPSTPLFDVRG